MIVTYSPLTQIHRYNKIKMRMDLAFHYTNFFKDYNAGTKREQAMTNNIEKRLSVLLGESQANLAGLINHREMLVDSG